jgi:hypothetical protein
VLFLGLDVYDISRAGERIKQQRREDLSSDEIQLETLIGQAGTVNEHIDFVNGFLQTWREGVGGVGRDGHQE